MDTSSNMTNPGMSMETGNSSAIALPGNPSQQTFILFASDGTPISIGIQDLDQWYFYFVRLSTILGAQLGATALLLILMLMLGQPKRLKQPVFLLNILSLVLNFFRCLLNILYYNGPFVEAFTFFTFAPYVPSTAYAASTAAEIFATLLLLTVEASLVMQANVVCANLKKRSRTVITGILTFVACLTISLRLALAIYKIRMIIDSTLSFDDDWLVQGSDLTTAMSICIFSGVLTFKLGAAVLSRRRMGLKQFGPMQVIFIMGGQTAIVPAIFCILQYTVHDSGLGSMTMTVVALSLPLSALWASTSTDRKTVSLLPGACDTQKGTQTETTTSMTSPISQRSFIKLAPAGGKTESTISSEPRVSDVRDWDVEHGIKVNRSFGVTRTNWDS